MADATTYGGIQVQGLTLEKLLRLTSTVFNVKTFGALGDGTTDDTAAIQAAINALSTAGGGTLIFPSGTYRVNGALNTLPNDSNTPVPGQNTLRFAGAGMGGQATLGLASPNSPTILELRGAASVAKIDSRGRGLLEIRDMTLSDPSGDDTPFIQVTNTVLRMLNVEVWGSKTGVSADQDVVILGGTDDTIDGTSDAPFQGYGTIISGCHFQRIRRAVYGRVHCNAIVLRDNTIWVTCGSNLGGGAAIEIDGDPNDITSASAAGVLSMGNLIEVAGYVYAYKFREMVGSFIGPDNIYDPGGPFTHTVRFEQGATFNTIVAGYYPDTKPFVSEAAAVARKNTIIDGHQGEESVFAQYIKFVRPIEIEDTATDNVHVLTVTDQSGDVAQLFYLGGIKTLLWKHTPSGESEQELWMVKDYGSGIVIVELRGTDTRIRSQADLIKLDDPTEVNGPLTFGASGHLHVRYFTDATRPAAGTVGRVIFNQDDGQLNIDNGTNWTLPDGTVT